MVESQHRSAGRLAARASFELQRLAQEFRGAYSRETIEQEYRAIVDEFESARVTAFVELLAARATRERLRAASRVQAVRERDEVLFASRNSVLGGLAACLFSERLGRSIAARVAGPPADPRARALTEALVPWLTLIFEPSALTLDLVQSASVVVTLQSGDGCPVVPGRRYVHWGVSGSPGDREFRNVLLEVDRRVEQLASELALYAHPDS
jgi:hypothetical protein